MIKSSERWQPKGRVDWSCLAYWAVIIAGSLLLYAAAGYGVVSFLNKYAKETYIPLPVGQKECLGCHLESQLNTTGMFGNQVSLRTITFTQQERESDAQ